MTDNSNVNNLEMAGIKTVAVSVLIVAAISANVLFAQAQGWAHALGKSTHLISLLLCIFLAVEYAGRGVALYVSALLFAYVMSDLFGMSGPYLVMLCTLYFFVGALISAQAKDAAVTTLQVISLASGLVMLLQVLGLSEWTQFFNTAGGGDIPLTPYPTFLVPVDQLQAHHVQGRPTGLFHSNPFACFIVLVTFSLTQSTKRMRSIGVQICLCAVAVITLAKIAYLGVLIVLAVIAKTGDAEDRRAAIRCAAMFVAFAILYSVLFPGLTQVFMFNHQTLVVSLMTRLIDIAVTLSPDLLAPALRELLASVERVFAASGNSPAAAHLYPQLIETYSKERLSAYTAIFEARAGLLPMLALGVLLACINRRVRHAARFAYHQMTVSDWSLLAALATFSLAANFVSAQIFWLFIGMAVPTGVTQTVVDRRRLQADQR